MAEIGYSYSLGSILTDDETDVLGLAGSGSHVWIHATVYISDPLSFSGIEQAESLGLRIDALDAGYLQLYGTLDSLQHALQGIYLQSDRPLIDGQVDVRLQSGNGQIVEINGTYDDLAEVPTAGDAAVIEPSVEPNATGDAEEVISTESSAESQSEASHDDGHHNHEGEIDLGNGYSISWDEFGIPDAEDYEQALFGDSDGRTWTGTTGQAVTIDYALNKTFSWHPLSGGQNLSAERIAAAEHAMTEWSSYANVTFNEVSASQAELGFKDYNLPSGVAGVAYNYQSSTTIINSVVSIDVAQTGFSQNGYGMLAMIHEVGHALGLKHPGNYNGSEDGPFLTNLGYTDSRDYTVMSYSNGAETGTIYPSTGMLFDIATIQYLYGANTSYNSGNTTYTIDGSSKSWTIWDGAGTDTINTSSYSSGGVTLDLREGVDYVNSVGQQTFWVAFNADIENATAGSGNDSLTGNSLSNVLIGGSGNDTLIGGSGSDTLNGGVGSDYYTGASGDGDDVITDSDGDGTLVINGKTLSGTATNQGGGVHQLSITGTTFLLTESGSDLVVSINGNSSDSWTLQNYSAGDFGITISIGTSYIGTSGAERLTGGEGNDTITGNNGSDTLDGGVGDDAITGGTDADQLYGRDGNDTLTGNAGADYLFGGAGDDLIYADADDVNSAVVDAGTGSDTVYLNGSTGVSLNLAIYGIETMYGSDGGDDSLNGAAASVALALYGRDGNDTLNAGSGSDTLDGGTGADVLYGRLGDDTLLGRGGNDTLFGHGGSDALYGYDGDDILYTDADDYSGGVVSGGTGTDTVYVEDTTGVSYNVFINEVEVFYGSDTGGDTVQGTGGSSAFTLDGRGGDDSLTGGSANDVLYGHDGADTLRGGDGADTLLGGAGDDFFYIDPDDISSGVIWGDTGSDTVQVTGSVGVSFNLHIYSIESAYGGSGNDLLFGPNDSNGMNLYGQDGNDTLRGWTGNDSLEGGTGVDHLYGRAGNDTLVGGTGADVLLGYNGDDVFYVDGDDISSGVIAGGSGTDTMYVTSGAGVIFNLFIYEMEAVYGSDGGNDRLMGTSSNGVTLSGRGGDDTLLGSVGDDTFIYGQGDGDDYIVKADDSDIIEISDYVWADLQISDLGGGFFDVAFDAQGNEVSGDGLVVNLGSGNTLDINDFSFI